MDLLQYRRSLSVVFVIGFRHGRVIVTVFINEFAFGINPRQGFANQSRESV